MFNILKNSKQSRVKAFALRQDKALSWPDNLSGLRVFIQAVGGGSVGIATGSLPFFFGNYYLSGKIQSGKGHLKGGKDDEQNK